MGLGIVTYYYLAFKSTKHVGFKYTIIQWIRDEISHTWDTMGNRQLTGYDVAVTGRTASGVSETFQCNGFLWPQQAKTVEYKPDAPWDWEYLPTKLP